MIEGDPTRDIGDIDTFKLWLISYRTSLSGNPSDRIMYPRERTIAHALGLDTQGSSILFLRNCPWSEVPMSIRDIMSKLYDAALLDTNKSVDVRFGTIGTYGIEFHLRSPYTDSNPYTDTYGENYIGMGLVLDLSDKGEWYFIKVPNALYNRWVLASDKLVSSDKDEILEVKDLMEQMRLCSQRLPVTLDHLHDVASFLGKSRDKSVVEYFPEVQA